MQGFFNARLLRGAWVVFFPLEVIAKFRLVDDSLVSPPFYEGAIRPLVAVSESVVAGLLVQAEPIYSADGAQRESPDHVGQLGEGFQLDE